MVKLVCPSHPLQTNITVDIAKNHSEPTSPHDEEMPGVVKYVIVLSLMAFTGAYSCGYGPGKSKVPVNLVSKISNGGGMVVSWN